MEGNLHLGECRICGRELSNPKSVVAGIGPVCAGRFAKNLEARMQMKDVHISTDIRDGFVFKRWDNGTPATNVPHLVVEHSPDGFEWGYGGSGPADLALNIVEVVLKRIGYRGITLDDEARNKYSIMAYHLHQDFKWKFIASLPREGGRIEYHDVLRWIYKKLVEHARKDPIRE